MSFIKDDLILLEREGGLRLKTEGVTVLPH